MEIMAVPRETAGRRRQWFFNGSMFGCGSAALGGEAVLYEDPSLYPDAIALSDTDVFVHSVGPAGSILRIAKTGGPVVSLFTAVGFHPDLIVDGNQVFWHDDAGVKTGTTSGTGLTVLAPEPAGAISIVDGIAVDAQYVYYVTYDTFSPSLLSYQVMRVLRGGGGATVLLSSTVEHNDLTYLPHIVGVDGTWLYFRKHVFPNEDSIALMSKSGAPGLTVIETTAANAGSWTSSW